MGLPLVPLRDGCQINVKCASICFSSGSRLSNVGGDKLYLAKIPIESPSIGLVQVVVHECLWVCWDSEDR